MKWKTGTFCLLLGLLFVFTAGCDKKTLRIFFDGVDKDGGKTAGQTPLKPGEQPAQLELYKHAPYAEGSCDSCHNPQKGHKLLLAREELCLTCHSIDQNKKYVHGPVASGDCLLCHDPHTSKYERLLLAEPRTFCASCHDPESLTEMDEHTNPEIQCTVCHEPHVSDNEYLLK